MATYEFYAISTPDYSRSFVSAWTGSVVRVSSSTLDTDFVSDQVKAHYDDLWERSFANSQDLLDKMAAEIEAKYLAGLTEEFDPDSDPDLQ